MIWWIILQKEDMFCLILKCVFFFLGSRRTCWKKTSWRLSLQQKKLLEESVQHIDIVFTLQRRAFFGGKKTFATQGIVAASVVEAVVEAVLEVKGVDLLELSSFMSKFNSSGRYLGLSEGQDFNNHPQIDWRDGICELYIYIHRLYLYRMFSRELATLTKTKEFEIWILFAHILQKKSTNDWWWILLEPILQITYSYVYVGLAPIVSNT